ncbi:c-type cytochrome [Altererythrobacter salegens]|uniref:C-type cytochrome n=1 Tax=Croceibacterium salegens TaxID=1737568 RepID=A0A6I4SYG4_9SPHN|nr:c-type cytochrome [Croceibacterium salegens]MXO61154.1 c-type cytochrome [Croceibacterium salegens]
MTSRLAVAATLAFILAACGSGETPAEEPSATPTMAEPVAAESDAPTADASAAPTPSASDAAAPAPTPTSTPTHAPTPAKVAAAGPPEAFTQCATCHSTEPGKTIIGPSLAGIYGEKAGAVAGFKFSEAMKTSGLTWNDETLDRYLADPKGVVPGTTMALSGIKDAGKRADIIAYIKSL